MFATKKPRSFRSRLAVEQFDARIVPAVLLTKLDLDGDGAQDDIRIVGDGQNSFVSIMDDGAGKVHVHIDANGNNVVDPGDTDSDYTFSKNSIAFDIQLKGGKDTLGYGLSSALTGGTRSFSVDLGGGNDGILFQGGTVQTGSHVDLTVNAGSGDDVVGIGWSSVNNSYVNVQTNMGSGNDNYTFLSGIVDSESTMYVKTDLGSGNDTNDVTVNSVGKFTHADLDMSIFGGAGNDTVNYHSVDDVGGGAGHPSSHLGVNVDLGAGNDTFVGKMDGNNFLVDDSSQASFVVKGGAGNDSLTMTRNGSGPIRVDNGGMCIIDLDGGAGNDSVIADFSGGDAWQLQSANASRLKIRLDGGAGNDTVNCLITNNSFTLGDFDIAMYGGAGNDSMWFATDNNGGSPTYGPTGKVLIDGGLGVDKLTNSNPAVTSFVGLEAVI